MVVVRIDHVIIVFIGFRLIAVYVVMSVLKGSSLHLMLSDLLLSLLLWV